MKRLLAVTALMAAGCAGEPFSRPPLPVLKHPEPRAVREGFATKLPDATHALHQSTLHFPFTDLTVLEQVDADRGKNEFGVRGFLPFGVMLFDLTGSKGTVTINTAAAEFNDYKFILESIGHDLRHAYLDLTPDATAKATVWPKEVFFAQNSPEGTLCFEFAYDPPVLIEKRLSGALGTVWRIRYYDYRTGPDGKIRPHGIVVDNSRYFYRIVLRGEDLGNDDAGKVEAAVAEGKAVERREIR